MKVNSNYKFEVSLSRDAYENKEIANAMIGSSKNPDNRKIRKKYGYKSRVGIGFERTTVTPPELLAKLKSGHVFCHLFNPWKKRKDGTFGSWQKINQNFAGAYVIGVDIDETKYKSINDYIDRLSLKPTLWYTSYSNGQPGKGLRFRLIYVFDKKLLGDPIIFRFYAYCLNQMIEQDTNEKIEDDCNLRCSQYFNGTNINNPNLNFDCGLTNNIFSPGEIIQDGKQLIDFIDNRGYYRGKEHDKNFLKLARHLIRYELSGQIDKPISYNNDVRVLLDRYFPDLNREYSNLSIPINTFLYPNKYTNNYDNIQIANNAINSNKCYSLNQSSYSGLENGEQYNMTKDDDVKNSFRLEYNWELDLTKGGNKSLFCQEDSDTINNAESRCSREDKTLESSKLIQSDLTHTEDNQVKASTNHLKSTQITVNSKNSNNVYNNPYLNQSSYSGLENGEQGSSVNINHFLLQDMDNMSYNQFNFSHGFQYDYIYRCENNEWINNLYQFTEPNSFSLYWNVNRVMDGSNRRKKVFERMCLRRIIKPTITPDEVCYCAYEDVHRFFDNSDRVFNSEYYERNCKRAFSMSLDEIEDMFSKNLAWLRSKRPKFILKKIYNMDTSTRNSMIKEVYDREISKNIDTSLSIVENLDKMKKQGFEISRSRLYNYYNEHNLNTNPRKLSDNDIINLLDVNLSVRKNFSALKSKGIKISIKRICKLLKGIRE